MIHSLQDAFIGPAIFLCSYEKYVLFQWYVQTTLRLGAA